MKIISIILIIALFLVLMGVAHSAAYFYFGYAARHLFGVSLQQVTGWEMPYLILFAVYAIAFGLSIFYYIKKMYRLSITIPTTGIIIYFIIPLFGYHWF